MSFGGEENVFDLMTIYDPAKSSGYEYNQIMILNTKQNFSPKSCGRRLNSRVW